MQAKRENLTTDEQKLKRKQLLLRVKVLRSKTVQPPCWLPRGQQVSHQRWIWGIHCMLATKHISKRIHPGFETQGRCHQKSKTGLSMAQQKGLMSSKQFLKNDKLFVKRRQSKNDLPDRAERNLNCLDILHTADCGWGRISLDSVPLCNRICASEDNEHIQMYKIDNKAFWLH